MCYVAVGTKGSIINNGSASLVIGGMAPYGYFGSKARSIRDCEECSIRAGAVWYQSELHLTALDRIADAQRVFLGLGKNIEEWICGMANLNRGAVLTAEDIAQAADYLGSNESKYVSERNFAVDGGFTSVNSSFALFKQE